MSLAAIDHSLSTTGAPVEGGCVWINFNDSPTLPTDATTDMSTLAGWESAGELTKDGYTEVKETNVTEEEGWHGDTVGVTVDKEGDKIKLALYEPQRGVVAKLRYGAGNVTVTDDEITHIEGKTAGAQQVAIVIDELTTSGRLSRRVAKKALVTNPEDVSHTRSGLMAYGMTFTLIKESGKAFDIYYATPATTTTTTTTTGE